MAFLNINSLIHLLLYILSFHMRVICKAYRKTKQKDKRFINAGEQISLSRHLDIEDSQLQRGYSGPLTNDIGH